MTLVLLHPDNNVLVCGVGLVEAVASGSRTQSEELGRREFLLTYKTFEPTGPGCLPRPR